MRISVSFYDEEDLKIGIGRLRETIYSKGSTEDAMDLFVNFRGRKAIIEPLLKVRGLDGSN